jgi:hypothetical protein
MEGPTRTLSDSIRLGETSALTSRSLCRSRTWNTHAANARLQMGRTPQSVYANVQTRIATFALRDT